MSCRRLIAFVTTREFAATTPAKIVEAMTAEKH
jgi:hypothetical protein